MGRRLLLLVLLTGGLLPVLTSGTIRLTKRDFSVSHSSILPVTQIVARGSVLRRFERVAGRLPRNVRTRFAVEYADSLRRERHVRYSVSFEVAPSERVHAYLYRPLTGPGPFPAVVALHSTGAGGKRIIDGETAIADRQYARELADRGYVVIAPDYPGFGEASGDDFSSDRYASGTMRGIFNHISCVSLLQSLPYVDGSRIGAIGHSLGGHNAIFLAAFDRRIKVVVSSCGWTVLKEYDAGPEVTASYGGKLGPWAQPRYMPRFRDVYGLDPARIPFDFDALIASLAPQAFLSISPLHDTNFSVDGVRKGSQRIAARYRRCHASDRFVVVYPDCGHDFPPANRHLAYQFLDRFLTPAPASVPAPGKGQGEVVRSR